MGDVELLDNNVLNEDLVVETGLVAQVVEVVLGGALHDLHDVRDVVRDHVVQVVHAELEKEERQPKRKERLTITAMIMMMAIRMRVAQAEQRICRRRVQVR